MSSLRKILLPLLLIPLGMILYGFLYPAWQWENPGLELLFALVGVPIVAVNFIAWFYPEVIRAYLPIQEGWLQSREKPILLAAAISALITFACIWFGAVSAVVNAGERSGLKRFDVWPVTATAFAHSVQVLSSATASGEFALVSTPRASPQATQDTVSSEATLSAEESAQIPVSGGEPTGSPTTPSDSTILSSTSPTLSVTQTQVASASRATTATISTAGTASSSRSCTRATQAYLDVISQAVNDADPDNEVTAGWTVQSNAANDLWFVSAKVQTSTGTSLPGVWGLFAYSDGSFDIYAINDVAMQLSYSAGGEDSEPVLTMQSDGAPAAYNCAVRGQ